jgi:lysophospholipase L1-like esterase
LHLKIENLLHEQIIKTMRNMVPNSFMSSLLFLFFLRPVSATLFKANDLRFVGRFDLTREYPSADWSGSGVTMFVKNSHPSSSNENTNELVDISLTANLDDVSGAENTLYFAGVLLNCELLGIFEVSSANNIIQFSFSTSQDRPIDEIYIMKLTEGSNGDAQGQLSLKEYTLSNNTHIMPQQATQNIPRTCRNPNNLKLLIIGDSITAAYGVEGVNPCSFTAATQNFMYSYAYLTAQALGADLTTVAWSGKGVVRNYGDPNPTSVNPMPTYYNRTLATLSTEGKLNYWDPSRYTPDVVLVMLGTNDYSTTPNPSDEDFTTGLVDFITLIKRDYPSALIGAMCAPSNHGNQCMNIENATQITGASFVSMNSSLYVSPDGCDGHPR